MRGASVAGPWPAPRGGDGGLAIGAVRRNGMPRTLGIAAMMSNALFAGVAVWEIFLAEASLWSGLV